VRLTFGVLTQAIQAMERSRRPSAKALEATKSAQKPPAKGKGKAVRKKQPPKKPLQKQVSWDNQQPVEPATELDLIVLPSSPPIVLPVELPQSSPAPEEAEYDMDFKFTLRVNGKRVLEDTDSFFQGTFWLNNLEDKVESLIASTGSTIDGRDYIWQSKSVSFKAEHYKSTWTVVTIADFGFAELNRLLDLVNRSVKRYKQAKRVDLKVELRVKVESLQKAFPRNRSFNKTLLDSDATLVS
jgi:hypothetical protein